MMILHEVAFETQARLVKEFRRHRQVALCRRDIHVAEIGRQLGQQIIQVCTAAIPGNETMNRACMPKIVKPRLASCSALASYTSGDAQSSKAAPRGGRAQRRAVPEAEEWGVRL